MADVSWDCKREWPPRGGPSCFFIMTHVDGVKQGIQLVSSLLHSNWLSTSEYQRLSEASNIFKHSAFYLKLR